MSLQSIDGITIPAATALLPFRLVKQDASGNATYCAVGTVRNHIGTVQNNVTAAGQPTAVRLGGASRTTKLVAAVAIAINAAIYYDANGQVGTTSAGNTQVGIALQAASGAGSVFEALLF